MSAWLPSVVDTTLVIASVMPVGTAGPVMKHVITGWGGGGKIGKFMKQKKTQIDNKEKVWETPLPS